MAENKNYKDVLELIDSSVQKINTEKEHLKEHMSAQDPNSNLDKELNEINELDNKSNNLYELKGKISSLKDNNIEFRYEELSDLSTEDISLLEDIKNERVNDLYEEQDLQEEFLIEENRLAAADIDSSSFNKSINDINEKLDSIDSEILSLNKLDDELKSAKELQLVNDHVLDESERSSSLNDELEKNNIKDSLELISNEIKNNGITEKLNDNAVFQVLKDDKELMEKAILYHQQDKVLDVLTKAKSQLENVNHAIKSDELNMGLKELQTNLQQDVNHLESKSKTIENKLGNSNVIDSISNKMNKTNEKEVEHNNEPNNTTQKPNKRRSQAQDLSL